MNRFFPLLLSIMAVLACTPTLDPDEDQTLPVPKHPVESVELTPNTLTLLPGKTFQLEASLLPKYATNKNITWTTSNADVATVENGLVTTLTPGEAVITATAEDKSATCTVTVPVPYSYDGMCMEAMNFDGGIITISNPNKLQIEYKVESQDWTSDSSPTIKIKVAETERVWFRGNNNTYYKEDEYFSYATTFKCSGDFYLYGNLMSLIYGDEFDSHTEITGDFAFLQLFNKNTHIYNHPTKDIELPATTLSPSCYRNMFYECSNLTRAPKLPAKILTEGCYASMFAYCTSIKEFPEMAATDMANMSCTWMMYYSGVEEAPELPATNLARSCYEFMFTGCSNLKKAMTVLPATELYGSCYRGMFKDCPALTKAPKLPAMNMAGACYEGMFYNSGLTEAPELPAMNLANLCYRSMFEGCLGLTKAPDLPATELTSWCYDSMFRGCANLNYIKADFLTLPLGRKCTENWVEGVAAEGTFVKNPEAKWDVWGVNGIPEGWTVE